MRSLLFWIPAGIIIILVWSLTQQNASIVLDLTPPAGEPERPSIFEAIQEQLRLAPEHLGPVSWASPFLKQQAELVAWQKKMGFIQ